MSWESATDRSEAGVRPHEGSQMFGKRVRKLPFVSLAGQNLHAKV